MILCRFEPGESDVMVEFNTITSVFTVTLPYSIFVKHEGRFVNELSSPFPMVMISYLWELERDGFLVSADIIETLRQISRRADTRSADRFAPRLKSRTDLKLVA